MTEPKISKSVVSRMVIAQWSRVTELQMISKGCSVFEDGI
jgi:hypothetical protein